MADNENLETFTCAACGVTLPKDGWTDEEARAEADALWTKEEMEREGEAIVCDSCFRRFMTWLEAHRDLRA